MKQFITKLSRIAIAGFFFLFPIYVVFIVLSKAWTSLTSVGSRLAAMFGVKAVLGVGGHQFLTGLLIIAIWLLCGLLVRVSFIGTFSRATERVISSLVPGYASYRAIAEEKIARKTRILPFPCAWLMLESYDQPVFIIDKDDVGNFVLFAPDVPDTSHGRVLVARADKLRMMPSLTANELEAILKKMGEGLLRECIINRKVA